MRFTNGGFNLFRLLRLNGQRLIRVVTMPLIDLYRKMRRYLNPNGFSSKVVMDIRKSFRRAISTKPESLQDYVAFPRHYVAKKLLFVIALLVIVLPILYIRYGHPLVQSAFLTRTMYVNAAEMAGYSGKVKLLSPTTNQLLYIGPLAGGRITGEGILNDHEGHLVYQGGFLQERYDGEGETFYPGGNTQYKGSFVKNNYEGTGVLYREDASLQYAGEFRQGLYEGLGQEHYANGNLRYAGGFAQGLYEGEGRLYDQEGRLVYRGGFSAGSYAGAGSLYENGELLYVGALAGGRLEGEGKVYAGDAVLYEGTFRDNRYDGAGRAYDPVTGNMIYDGAYVNGQYNGVGRLFEPQSGALLYEGEFYEGVYEGTGTLYDPLSGIPLYEGGFRLGRFDGDGTLYDATTGLPVYIGRYLLDNFNGAGAIYDARDGSVIAEGIFLNGVLAGTLPLEAEGSGSGDLPPDGAEEPDGTEEPNTAAAPVEAANAQNNAVGAVVYRGPRNDAGVDYLALAALDGVAAQAAFSGDSLLWTLDGGSSRVYEDVPEKLGLTLQLDNAGKLLGVDVWNSALVQGAQVNMTRAQLEAVLGAATGESQENLGDMRLVSISQSNRFHNRLTNLSASTQVTAVHYPGGVSAIFVNNLDGCLLLEIRK